MTNPLTIRPAVLADIPLLRQFEQGVIKAERPFDPTLQPDPIQYYNLEAMIASPNCELLVAELDDTVIGSGYARIEEAARHYLIYTTYAYLGFMYVDPAHRGIGVNQAIIDALHAWSKSRGITEMRLDVYNDNTRAVRAYEKSGFTPILLTMRKGI